MNIYTEETERANRMHRRAQRAEGAMQRARFWIECIEKRGQKTNDAYIVSVAKEVIKEMDRNKKGDE